MPEKKALFMKILKAELEDCLEDVEDLANLYEKRHKENDLSNYVYQGNEALLSRELSGIRIVLKKLELVSIEEFEDVEALASAVDGMVQNTVVEYEDPEAVYGIAKRKLLKVLHYIQDTEIQR